MPETEPFMDADREYFEQHPNETSYERANFDDEHPYCDGPHLVTVQEIAPGLRIRTAEEIRFFNTGAETAIG